MADGRVSVIPATTEALQAVQTPYVAFEHPFKDRPGRYERQADMLDQYGSQYMLVMGDVWPACLWQRRSAHRLQIGLRGIADAHALTLHVWPETALYRTPLARLGHVNERIRYRPQMAFWAQLYERVDQFLRHARVIHEAQIDVPDSLVYMHEPELPSLSLADPDIPLTVIMATENHRRSIEQSWISLERQTFKDWELRIVDCGSTDGTIGFLETLNYPRVTKVEFAGGITRAEALNRAMQGARGERFAVWDPSCVSTPERFERQLRFPGDLTCCQYAVLKKTDGRLEWWPAPIDMFYYAFTRYSVRETLPLRTLMFNRRVVTQRGGFDQRLSTGYGYEFTLRALDDESLSCGSLSDQLVIVVDVDSCDERAYGRHYHTLVMRDIAARFNMKRGLHGWLLTK